MASQVASQAAAAFITRVGGKRLLLGVGGSLLVVGGAAARFLSYRINSHYAAIIMQSRCLRITLINSHLPFLITPLHYNGRPKESSSTFLLQQNSKF